MCSYHISMYWGKGKNTAESRLENKSLNQYAKILVVVKIEVIVQRATTVALYGA